MPIITPQNSEVTKWKGLHLFHFAISNCSQRVRIMLAEKKLTWTSHHLDLANDEHVTPWYQGINPKGVVPTLIDDGTVVVESTDILAYLDKLGGGESLLAGPDIDTALVDQCLASANAMQGSIKLLSHEFLFKPKARKNSQELERISQTMKNRDLVAFHNKFSSADGFSKDEIQKAVCAMHGTFQQLEQCLQQHQWLAGNHFSIADITWVVNFHRLELMRFPLTDYPKLSDWFRRVAARPSYREALLAYEPKGSRRLMRFYNFFRTSLGRNPLAAAPC